MDRTAIQLANTRLALALWEARARPSKVTRNLGKWVDKNGCYCLGGFLTFQPEFHALGVEVPTPTYPSWVDQKHLFGVERMNLFWGTTHIFAFRWRAWLEARRRLRNQIAYLEGKLSETKELPRPETRTLHRCEAAFREAVGIE